MRRFCFVLADGIAIFALMGLAEETPATGPYRISKTVKVDGAGTFDTAFADIVDRRLYIPRKNSGRIMVFNLDTLEPVGEIPDASANGVVVDVKSGHGFASSKPVVMWDTKTLKTLKTIEVQGGPDATGWSAHWSRPDGSGFVFDTGRHQLRIQNSYRNPIRAKRDG